MSMATVGPFVDVEQCERQLIREHRAGTRATKGRRRLTGTRKGQGEAISSKSEPGGQAAINFGQSDAFLVAQEVPALPEVAAGDAGAATAGATMRQSGSPFSRRWHDKTRTSSI
ncbi:hypothetical protein HYQ44_019507 [Verticillium longisporum]|nr:hypothetical protein HYQ44_019507 [Verticillium longisporum]